MIEQLLRLIPRWFVPAILSATGWLFFIHHYVSDTIFYRMTLPLMQETRTEAKAYAAYHETTFEPGAVDKYLRCVYGTVQATEGFRFGFSVYLASGTLIGGDALNEFGNRVNAVLQSQTCGAAPWTNK